MTGEGAQFSGTELQLLVQMMNDVRTGVQDVDRKLDRMVPRPEFEQYQAATRERFAALESRISEKEAAHAGIEAKIEAVESKGETSVESVRTLVQVAEKERNERFRSLNGRIWFALAGTALTVIGGVVLNALN